MKRIPIIVACLGLLGACVDEPGPEPGAPTDVVDAKGNRWRLRGPATLAADGSLDPADAVAARAPDVPSSDAERAASLRPVVFFDGNEYELDASDDEILARYAAIEAQGRAGGAPGAPDDRARPDERGPQGVVAGTDDRIPIGYANVRYYPSSAVGVSVSMTRAPYWEAGGTDACTLTMIGPSTAISAAHCFYRPNVGWHPVKSWAFGVSSLFGAGRNLAYPTTTGCYWVTIPSGATTSRSPYYDYAVIEFSNSQAPTCNLFPGYAVGWYGWWTASDEQIENTNVRINGYPSPAPAGSFVWPSEFTQGDYRGALRVDGSRYLLRFDLDVTGGNSGSGLAQELFAPGDRYVTGIVVGEAETNWGRRLDATVRDFVLAYSAL
ncbi:MAG: hypothetical protein H6708_10085 [Kofleriaceae bacterium]|nr:hypothetical protein [Kofleriaceae bacterium]